MFACGGLWLSRSQRRIFAKQNIFANDNYVGRAPACVPRAFGCAASYEVSIREAATHGSKLIDESGQLILNAVNYVRFAKNAYIEIAYCDMPNSLADPAGRAERCCSEGADAIGTPNAGLPGLGPRKRCRLPRAHPTSGPRRTPDPRYRRRGASRVRGSSRCGEKAAHAGIRSPVQAGDK